MKCFNCAEETNPTLVYCQNCGVPLETEPEDLVADEEERAAERTRIQALAKAKQLFVLALFLFGSTVALRFIMLEEQEYDHFVSYRIPYVVVEEAQLKPARQVPDPAHEGPVKTGAADPDDPRAGEFQLPIPTE